MMVSGQNCAKFVKFCLWDISSTAKAFRENLELVVSVSHFDGPAELLPLGLVVDLLQGNVILETPGDGNSRIQVVQLGGAERDLFVLLLVGLLSLEPVQLLKQPLDGCLLLLGITAFALLRGLELALGLLDLLGLFVDLLLEVGHRLVVGLGDSALMVAEQSDRPIRPVVRQHLKR